MLGGSAQGWIECIWSYLTLHCTVGKKKIAFAPLSTCVDIRTLLFFFIFLRIVAEQIMTTARRKKERFE